MTADAIPPAGSDGRLSDANELRTSVEDVGNALLSLSSGGHPELASMLARFVTVIAREAARSPRFARALGDAATDLGAGTGSSRTKRPHRRSPGPIDPFAVYAEHGEAGLRERLTALTIEQLRDIVAEHRMDHDRLAMKWKDPARVIDRIIEHVQSRSVKGDVFRKT